MSVTNKLLNNLHDYTTSSVSGTDAIAITNCIIYLTTTGACTGLTLADGELGQVLCVVFKSGSDNAVISVANVKTYSTSIILDNNGDYVILEFDGVEWVVKKLGRGATAS